VSFSPKEVDFHSSKEKQIDYWWCLQENWLLQRQRKTVFMGIFFQMNQKLKLFFIVFNRTFSILPMIFLSCPS